MRFLHLADLHFGKSIYGVSLLDNGDQPAIILDKPCILRLI